MISYAIFNNLLLQPYKSYDRYLEKWPLRSILNHNLLPLNKLWRQAKWPTTFYNLATSLYPSTLPQKT
jgi:hypothetical protein